LKKILDELDLEFTREWGNTLRKYADDGQIDPDSRTQYLTKATAASGGLAWVLTVGRGGEGGGFLNEWGPNFTPIGVVIVFPCYKKMPATRMSMSYSCSCGAHTGRWGSAAKGSGGSSGMRLDPRSVAKS